MEKARAYAYRMWFRHCARTHSAHLRSFFYDQEFFAGRPTTRNRPRAFSFLRNHSGARREDPCREPSWSRNYLCFGFSVKQETSARIGLPVQTRMRTKHAKPKMFKQEN